MTRPPAVLSARVSSARHAEAHTVESQVAARRERLVRDGLPRPDARPFLDEGFSGATLVRPALERRREAVASGAVDRLSVHAPERLARQYAYQGRWVDEWQRAGVEVVCLHRELGQTPEDEVRLQGQGMMAAYARAKMLERHRRGKRHAARAGSVTVLVAAPSGDRDLPKHHGSGQAREERVAEEARVVRQMFEWVGHERVTSGDVGRRLSWAGEPTRTGKAMWDRRVVWGLRKNPASRGTAAFGKTRQGPPRPRLRAQRGRPLPPRRATAPVEMPREEWRTIPVPAMVEPELFAAVQEPRRDNQRHARPYRRGAQYLRQGLVNGPGYGDAEYGKSISHKAANGKTRDYA
jgi:site-specific DNA recombinase